MAEGVLFDIIGKVIGKLVSMVGENWSMKDDLERLIEHMTDIKGVVLDAEEQQSTNHQVQVCLLITCLMTSPLKTRNAK
ncbi:hypothetical protein Fmac_025001 [Flemingia macrophylla]|uniref:Disease resistance N-terminal domain-containing protein n=1 Tax=Flemingia macrophylla TaxID=520843 RepID=A0ABD1LR34_9FABA